ncbi:MAG: PAS domain S-box protein [Proteobacteria bacterium]|nr:PAS domain S-box protein [Pseudomonadota bacterium]
MRTDIEKDLLLQAIDSFKRSIIIISPDLKIISANKAVYKSGTKNIKIGRLCHKALYNRKIPCDNCLAKAVMDTKKPAVRKGKEGIMSLEKVSCLYSYPIFDDNKITSLAIMDFSMSTMEKMEERLHHSNSFLNNLIKSAIDGIIASDMNGRILIFNDAACKITGYHVDEVIGKLDIRQIYPKGGAKHVMKMLRSDQSGEKGTLRSFRVDLCKKDREIIPISLNAAIVYEDGRETATLGFFHDLRETLKIEAELEKTRVQLLQAEKMSSLGELAAGVAHQLNNPLGGITLYTQLMMEDYDLPENARKDLERILQDAQRCSNIVKELLKFSRQTSNEIHPQDINRILSETLFLVENQTLFQNIVVEKDFQQSLPLVPVDIQKIKHVFMNIILNAADAMEGKGLLSLSTWLAPSRDRVCIEISDTGPGIEDDVLLKIFDTFFTTKEQGKGTGLGLSMAYRIIEDHGGKIFAESKVGVGTVFFVELMLTTPAQNTAGDTSNEK